MFDSPQTGFADTSVLLQNVLHQEASITTGKGTRPSSSCPENSPGAWDR